MLAYNGIPAADWLLHWGQIADRYFASVPNLPWLHQRLPPCHAATAITPNVID